MDVLLVIDSVTNNVLRPNGGAYVEELEEARAAIAGLIEATPALLALYRIKWGNLDPDANAVLATFERAFSRVGGA